MARDKFRGFASEEEVAASCNTALNRVGYFHDIRVGELKNDGLISHVTIFGDVARLCRVVVFRTIPCATEPRRCIGFGRVHKLNRSTIMRRFESAAGWLFNCDALAPFGAFIDHVEVEVREAEV